ncbi:TonB-dependent receptor [Agaribacterium sp. ZY112]|uniref:TonB-dependent receptor n=1 Tax=Agaribacterium sp. ZY112 TaxID=3233574 RepID=UPI00352620B4
MRILATTALRPLAIAVAFYGHSLCAAEQPRLEEVIVAAQKRQENLQQVPLSVAAISATKIAEAGIETIDELSVHLPNIHFTETGFSTQVRIRGIGSDNSQGFEQSVGMYVDGIYHGRAQLFRLPMMDMQRIEVLRGPQSTLFGKNSIAGALNLTTARPTENFEGFVSLSHEFKHDQNEINAVISGPLTDTLRARLTVRGYQEDGYFYNSSKATDEAQAEESAARLSLEWDARDNLNFFLKAEQNKFETQGRPMEITYDKALAPGYPNYAQSLALLQEPSLESEKNYVRQSNADESSDNTVNNLTLTADYQWGDYTISSVSGLLDFNYDEHCDCDYTASDILPLPLSEDYEQFSQELRIASDQNGAVEWIGGLYYQGWKQTYKDELGLSPNNILPAKLSQTPGREGLAYLANTGLKRHFEQESDSWAAFARLTWHATERLHLTAGARYTEEQKKAQKQLWLYDLPSDNVNDSTALGFIYLNTFIVETEQAREFYIPPDLNNPAGPLVWGGHNVEKTRKEEVFTPLINIEFDINDQLMTYASYTTGYKAGGFDPRSNTVGNLATPAPLVPPNTAEANPYLYFEFEEETAQAYELGLKSSIADGRGEINVSLYRTDYEDLQVSQFDGAVGFNTGNAPKTTVQGVELDGRWALSNELTATYGASFLDFEYKDFKNGNCFAGQTSDGSNGGIATCDYTGKRGVYTPKYTINASLDYRRFIVNDMQFVSFVDAQWVDTHNVHVNLDPEGEIDAYTMLGARIGLETERWGIALLGKNLLNEYIISYSGNAPLSDSSFNTNTHYSFIRRPLTLALEGTVRF